MSSKEYIQILPPNSTPQNSTTNLLKIDYLTKQKNILQIELAQLRQNNDILRHINAQIIQNADVEVQRIIQSNANLQVVVRKLTDSNRMLRAEIVILGQLMGDMEVEFREVENSYEQKILQLRRSIQTKQIHMQNLQQSYIRKSWTHMDTKSLRKLTEYSQLQHQLEQLQALYRSQQVQTKKLKKQNTNHKQLIRKLEYMLILGGAGYRQYNRGRAQGREGREEGREGRQARSLGKAVGDLGSFQRKGQGIGERRFEKVINDSSANWNETRPSYGNPTMIYLADPNRALQEERVKVSELKKIAQSKIKQLHLINKRVKVIQLQLQTLKMVNKKLIDSNYQHQKHRKKITSQTRRSQSLAKTLYNMLTQRPIHTTGPHMHTLPNEQSPRKQVLEKYRQAEKEKQKQKQKERERERERRCKVEWMEMKEEIEERMKIRLVSGRNGGKRNRGFSCVLDYVVQGYGGLDEDHNKDNISQAENKAKKGDCVVKGDQEEKLQQELVEEEFSLMLEMQEGHIGDFDKCLGLAEFEESGIYSKVAKKH